MKQLNRRSFMHLSAASAAAVTLAASGCAPSAANQESELPLFIGDASAPADGAGSTADEATLAATIAGAADAFLQSLDDAQHSQATYAFTDPERFRWHWTTPRNFPRNGLPLRNMSEEQKRRAYELLQTALSQTGLQKALNIMALQHDLGNDPELYYVTIFGTPGSGEPWGWRWEGHHLSHHFSIVGDAVATTPFFVGAWPTTTEAGKRAMAREEDAALELVNSLPAAALEIALFQQRTLTRHETQNAARVDPLTPTGVLYSDLTTVQQMLVDEIIETYLRTQPAHVAQPSLARVVEAGVEQIRFAWAGSTQSRNPQDYRLQGPTFLLEFDNSRNGGTHIHSVWRDFQRDFGFHLL